MSSIKGKDRSAACREFGLVMGLALCCIGALLFYRGRSSSLFFFLGTGFFVVPALLFPLSLSALEKVWMAFAEKLSFVMTTLIMFVTFYVVITPLGLLLRLLKKDLLSLEIDREAETYWCKVEVDGPAQRYHTPY
jgi:uncharacterized oligopeptide transporter (OPT) family protein